MSPGLRESDDDACDRVWHRLRQSECRLAARRPTTPGPANRRLREDAGRHPSRQSTKQLSSSLPRRVAQPISTCAEATVAGTRVGILFFAPAICPRAGPSATRAVGGESSTWADLE